MFWNRNDLPAELKDRKPEEIVEALKKLDQLESRSKEFETTKTELENQLNTQKGEYETVRQKLHDMEAGVQQAQQQWQQWQQQQQQGEPPNIWSNPEQYIQDRIQQNIGGTQVVALGAARMGAALHFENSLSPRDKKIYKKYAKEVEQAINAYQPAAQGQPQNWYVAFNLIKGLHEQEIGKMEADSTPFFAEPGSRGAEPPPPPEDKLTADEEDIVRRMHWDPAGYLKQRQQMTTHTAEKGAYAKFPVPMRTRS